MSVLDENIMTKLVNKGQKKLEPEEFAFTINFPIETKFYQPSCMYVSRDDYCYTIVWLV